MSASGSILRTNSDKNITDLQKLVRPELKLVTVTQHTRLLGFWNFLFRLYKEISCNMLNLFRIGQNCTILCSAQINFRIY